MKWHTITIIVFCMLCIIFGPETVGTVVGSVLRTIMFGIYEFMHGVWRAGIGR